MACISQGDVLLATAPACPNYILLRKSLGVALVVVLCWVALWQIHCNACGANCNINAPTTRDSTYSLIPTVASNAEREAAYHQKWI